MTSPGTVASKNRAQARPTRRPIFLILYASVVGLAAAYLATLQIETSAPWWGLVLFWVLMLLTEFSPAWLPRGGYSTPASALDFAAILLLGPMVASLLVVTSSLVSQLFLLRRPPIRAAYNASLFTLMAATSGHVFLLLGGTPGSITLPGQLPAMVVAALAYFAVNALGVSLVIGITQRSPVWRILHGNYLTAVGLHLSNLAIGATGAIVFQAMGPWGILLFLLPLITAGTGFRRYYEMKRDLLEFVRALAQVLEEVDPYTREHSLRVAEYSKLVARELRVSEREIEDIEYGALLHDLGKIGRQYQDILQKPGALDRDERLAIMAHPDRGADIVARVRALHRAAEYVRCHHERMDGTGYPRGIQASTLPVGARIITACDAFDAMTSDRSYRAALRGEDALEELRACSPEQFDPQVVSAMVDLWESGRMKMLYVPLITVAEPAAGPVAESEPEPEPATVQKTG